jgi:imidazole glycerol-phosphate synthase subunit HisF
LLSIRVIPILLLKNNGLVKGRKFKDHRYVGDPINAVKIFNDKGVDEMVFLDIGVTGEGSDPNYNLLRDIVSEAFMPFGYGGGLTNCSQIEHLFKIGIEKVILNTGVTDNFNFITDASRIAGSQSVVVSIDVRKSFTGAYNVYSNSGRKKTVRKALDYAKHVEDSGAGEIILCSINHEGTRKGFDLELLRHVCREVTIPVVASGGAGQLDDFRDAITLGEASAVAAGNMFIFQGKHNAVLPSYPSSKELKSLFKD